MASDLIEGRSALEFLVTVFAVLLGLVLGKYISKALAGAIGQGAIASGDPVPLTLPGQPVLPWRR